MFSAKCLRSTHIRSHSDDDDDDNEQKIKKEEGRREKESIAEHKMSEWMKNKKYTRNGMYEGISNTFIYSIAHLKWSPLLLPNKKKYKFG